MEEMSIFADKYNVKDMLQEYLRRVLLHKPEDPVAFLISEIKNNPYTPDTVEEEKDDRPEELRSKFIDMRDEGDKTDLLREIFVHFDKKNRGLVNRAELLVGLKAKPQLLLERFPKHIAEISKTIEKMECGSKDGVVSWDQFSAELLACLSEPGGR